MFNRFRSLMVAGLLILAGCLPASPTGTEVPPDNDANQAAQIKAAQVGTPVTATSTLSVGTATNTLDVSATATTFVTPSVTSTPPSLTPTLDPFPNFPEEYRRIQFPQHILDVLRAGGFVVPLPQDKEALQRELLAFAYRPDLSRFDLNRIVNFAFASSNQYIAVPITPEYFKAHFGNGEDFTRGALVALVLDKNGGYNRFTRNPAVYEIWAYENYVSLTDVVTGKAIILEASRDEYYWRTQDVSSDLPLTVFVKGSCYLCWQIDQRCGCLVCTE